MSVDTAEHVPHSAKNRKEAARSLERDMKKTNYRNHEMSVSNVQVGGMVRAKVRVSGRGKKKSHVVNHGHKREKGIKILEK